MAYPDMRPALIDPDPVEAQMSSPHRSERPHLIRSGLVLSSGNLTAALMNLARNVIIARLISVEDFGIAATLAITMAMAEMASNIALDRLLVQARDGEDPQLIATLHSIQAARGLFAAVVLFVIAHPVSLLFGLPEVAWAYQAMAAIPLLRGLANLDMFRRQRNMQFLPFVLVEGTANLLSAVAALPLALWLGDYRVMLYALLIQQLVHTAGSHYAAIRPYRWRWDREVVRRAVGFGWPLLLNGFLMFGIFQGDRIIVGSLIGMKELGWFSAAFSVTMVPALVLASTLNKFFLPQLSQLQDDGERFTPLYQVVVQCVLLLSVLMLGVIVVFGPPVFMAMYGPRYEAALPILILLGAMQALRLFRVGPTIVSLSQARTTNPLIANILRALALPVAGLIVWHGGGIFAMIITALAGELLALLVSLLLLRYRIALRISSLMPCLSAAALVVCLVVLDVIMWPPGPGLMVNLHSFQWITLAVAIFMLWYMRPLRCWIWQSFSAKQAPTTP